jgi:site-specific recombinase XerD
MENKGINTFSLDVAQSWCKNETPVSHQSDFSFALLRLADVYGQGRILSSHLTIHGELSDGFTKAINTYLDSMSTEDFVESSFLRYREACSMFCRFCQINGVYSIEEIGYSVLEQYHQFITESDGSYKAYEGCAERMLMYWFERCSCRVGYSLFLHYARFGKCTCLDDLPSSSHDDIEGLHKKSSCFPADKFFYTIPAFIERMIAFGYCKNTTHAAAYYLKVLYIFLDREDLGYDRSIANIWVTNVGVRLFGKSKLNTLKRTLDLFDDYITNGDINPNFICRHIPSAYATLPQWCKSSIEKYKQTRKKEGIKQSTLKKQIYICAKFSQFMLSEGLKSFEELRPHHIKCFNLQDKHESSAGKNNVNHTLKHFLIHLELQNIVQPRLYQAISCSTADKESIIKILHDEDKSCIDLFCCLAETPIELRDAAILRLGMSTALRGCDIVSLKISDIDWKSRCIRIIQKKTDMAHVHPVNTGTLNAIFRYLCEGRNKKASTDHVFIRSMAPYGPVTSEICRQAMRRAGTSVTDFHRLRRSYATDSLKAGATFSEVAELLGHSDTSTVNKYVLLDEERMRLCPLSLEETGLVLEGRYKHAE